MDAVEEIQAKISIVDLVSEYVVLKKSGRNFKGLSPFKAEKTPSFIVSPDKGLAYCFATQQGGGIFKFIQLVEGVEFKEALKILADKAGVKLPEYSKEKGDLKKEAEKVLLEVVKFYHQEFINYTKVKDYWFKRGFTEATTNLFQIGYAPDSFNKTWHYLQKNAYLSEAIITAGLIIEKDEKKGDYFDRFRDRLMIPLHNHFGKIVGLAGRTIDNNPNNSNQAKYLNTPDTVLYNKSSILFGLDKTKEFIKKEDSVIILEGYMDVMSSFQAGVKNVVAVSGTALTNEHLKLLKRFTNNLKLCFDQDSAGREATKRSIELASEHDFNISVILINGAKDTDEIIKQGVDLWINALNQSISSFDFFCLEAEERLDIKDLAQQKQFVHELLHHIKKFPSMVVQQNYVKKLAEKCGLNPKILMEEFKKIKNETKISNKVVNVSALNSEKITAEKYLLGILSFCPDLIAELISSLILQNFQDSDTKHIYKMVIDNYNESQSSSFWQKLSDDDLEKINIWQLYAEGKNEFFNEFDLKKEFIKTIQNINLKNLQQEEQKVINKMKKKDMPKNEQEHLAWRLIELQKLKTIIQQSN